MILGAPSFLIRATLFKMSVHEDLFEEKSLLYLVSNEIFVFTSLCLIFYKPFFLYAWVPHRNHRITLFIKEIIMDEGSSFKRNAMKKHMQECAIEPDYVAPGNSRANGITKQTIQEVNGRMHAIGPQELMKWHKHLKDIKQAICTKPILLTTLSLAEIVHGRPLRTNIDIITGITDAERNDH